MHRRWPRPMSASPSAREPMSRSSRPASSWYVTTRAMSSGAIKLSRATYRKMVQNLIWATGYNAIAIPVAAGVLAPWGIILPMSVGALVMSISTIVVAVNAQLLRGLKLRPDQSAATGVAVPRPA